MTTRIFCRIEAIMGLNGPVTLDPPAIRWLRSNWPGLALTVGLLALIGGALLLLRWRRQVFFQSPEILARLFDVLSQWAARLRVSWLPSQTPLERAAAFNETVPEAGPAVDRLANLFVAKYYGRATPSSEDCVGAGQRLGASGAEPLEALGGPGCPDGSSAESIAQDEARERSTPDSTYWPLSCFSSCRA